MYIPLIIPKDNSKRYFNKKHVLHKPMYYLKYLQLWDEKQIQCLKRLTVIQKLSLFI